VGYFSFNGNLDRCITIRTALLKDGKAYVQAGGGWVNDSEPEAEFQETVNRARRCSKPWRWRRRLRSNNGARLRPPDRSQRGVQRRNSFNPCPQTGLPRQRNDCQGNKFLPDNSSDNHSPDKFSPAPGKSGGERAAVQTLRDV
jgi:hypothetical protein